MFKKAIVGIDGREGGQDALMLARLLLDPEGELVLAHIYPLDPVAWRGGSAAFELAEREEAGTLLRKAREDFGVSAQLVCHGATSVGRGLHEAADKLDADLLVMGSSSKGLVGHVLTGDHTRQALDGSPCAVAVAPRGYSHVMTSIRRVGVGYNESPESDHALGVARALAAERGAQLAVCQVVFVPAAMYAGIAWPGQEAIDTMLTEAEQRLGHIEDAEVRAVLGSPDDELTQFSETLDLMVIGSRGYGPWGRLIYGSTARDLSRLAHCPLLVLTRGARQRDTDHRADSAPEVVAAGSGHQAEA